MDGILLAIDPGRDQGWAEYDLFTRHLLDCGVGSPARQDKKSAPQKVVIEKPQVYNSRTSNARPADIIKLAIRVGVNVERYKQSEIYLVEPGTWKGQLDKKTHHARVLRELSLNDQCLILARDIDHNGMDAVALGLWALKRGDLAIFRWRG